VPNVVAIVNQPSHSDFFKEVGVRISENPDELVAARLYYWTQNPQLQQLASIPGGSIFEIVAEDGAPIVGHEIRELKVKDFVFIAIRRIGGELIIPSGNVKIQAKDIFTVFTKKEAEDDCLRLLNKQLKRSAE
jgi:trk system potassium uptake protein TrkA